jgi:RNA polymerase sigma-70 factor (ECF subfamily)
MNLYLNQSDTNLISRLQQGDRKAFEIIYRSYAGELYRYALKSIDRKEDCEEIVQDVFESLWRRREDLGHVETLSAYLFTTVKYKVIRYFQHSRVKHKYEEHFLLFEAVYDTHPEGEREGLHIVERIEKGLLQLPERCQQAVKLRLHENLSNTEIAERMSINKGTVENYMVTAIRHLKSIFAEPYKTSG